MPRSLYDASSKFCRDLNGTIARAAIENKNFVTAAQAFNHTRDIPLFIERDDRGRNLHLTSRLMRYVPARE